MDEERQQCSSVYRGTSQINGKVLSLLGVQRVCGDQTWPLSDCTARSWQTNKYQCLCAPPPWRLLYTIKVVDGIMGIGNHWYLLVESEYVIRISFF